MLMTRVRPYLIHEGLRFGRRMDCFNSIYVCLHRKTYQHMVGFKLHHAAWWAAMYCANACGLRVCMNTVPGPATQLALPWMRVFTVLTSELADQAFASAEVADYATARHALENIFAVPGDKVTVVDDVLFAIL